MKRTSAWNGDSLKQQEKIENLGDENYAIVQARKRAVWFLVEQYKSGSRYQIIQMINHYKQTSTQKQNQNQIGTTATLDYT